MHAFAWRLPCRPCYLICATTCKRGACGDGGFYRQSCCHGRCRVEAAAPATEGGARRRGLGHHGLAVGSAGRALSPRALYYSDRLYAAVELHRSAALVGELPAADHRAALRPRDAQHVQGVVRRHARLPRPRLSARLRHGAAQRLALGHVPGRGRHVLLDRLCGAHLRVAHHPRPPRSGERVLCGRRPRAAAAIAVHFVRRPFWA